MVAIQLDGVSKQYGSITALRNVDLTVESGEIFGFLGPNGAGKSTTIDILLDFVRPTNGSATVLGHDAQTESVAVRSKTGVLPDGYHVYDRLSGREHVQFAIDSKESTEDPLDLLDRVGIADAADRNAGGYSKGMTQRLVLAMALAGEPELLILDEPSTGLDPNGAREMRKIIREEADRGATVFFSSHILEQVEAICDRVGILNNGELVAEDTISGLRASLETDSRLDVTLKNADSGAVSAAEDVAGVISAIQDGSMLSIALTRESKYEVLAALDREGYSIVDFTTDESSLDDLFAAVTREPRSAEGHTEEDAAAAPTEVEQ